MGKGMLSHTFFHCVKLFLSREVLPMHSKNHANGKVCVEGLKPSCLCMMVLDLLLKCYNLCSI